MIIPSELKVTEPYNECPGGNAIRRQLAKNSLENYSLFVDLDTPDFWQNDRDTAVIGFKIDGASEGFKTYVEEVMVEMGKSLKADEVDFEYPEGYVIVRLWWD